MTHSSFMKRRNRLLQMIGDGVAVIPTAAEAVRNRDAHYPYRPDSYFWYLTGFGEPESVLVLVGGANPISILFCRPKHSEREIWDGFRYGPDVAREVFGVDQAFPIGELDAKLPELLAGREVLWHTLGIDRIWDQRVGNALEEVRQQARNGTRVPTRICDLRAALDGMRLLKDDYEIALMKTAANVTSDAHRRAMQVCQPGLMEYVLEAEISHEFRSRGSEAHAYTPIVAGGKNACTLHYVGNDQPLRDGELVLIDAGCEWQNYAADITRVFPVNGRFTAVQKDCYEIVLASQQAAIAAVKPGHHFMQPHEAALRVLTQGMVDLGLLAGTVDGLLESGAYKPFYMHRTSHWLGLDVHDAGDYKHGAGANEWVVLQPGMVLTIEPGLYIRPGEGVPKHLENMGIRIEDDALVTHGGVEIYTTAPKTVSEIEACCRGNELADLLG